MMIKDAHFEKIQLDGCGDVYYTEETTSTNDIAAQLGKEQYRPFTTIWANTQTKGRGRLGRTWQTYPEVGLAFSVIIPQTTPLLPLVTSVCLHQACGFFINEDKLNELSIKWPNDILVGSKKLAGILIESHIQKSGERFYVVGIGLNVRKPPQGFIEAPQAVALDELCSIPPERLFVLGAILRELQKNLDVSPENRNDADVIAYYKKYCTSLGQNVTWKDNGQNVEGTAKDITPNGHLILNTINGDITCHVGDIIHPKE
mgnify:CR=1 FL=1